MKTEECKDGLYRATPPGRDTGKGYKYRFLFLLFPTTCFTSVSVFITIYYVKVSCGFLARVFGGVIFNDY